MTCCVKASTIYQLLDIISHTNYQLNKNGAYLGKHICLHEIFHKEKLTHATRKKLYQWLQLLT